MFKKLFFSFVYIIFILNIFFNSFIYKKQIINFIYTLAFLCINSKIFHLRN